MSIQIKEIITSDTISGLVEKLNYNFDQILLNGGGPRGPQGVSGVKGNIGARGMRGNIWIVQDVEPVLNNDDYIPGDKLVLSTGEIKTVVESGGVKTWASTNVNIKGETGDKGDNDVVSYIQQGTNDKKIVHFKKYEYGDPTYHSLSTVLIGGASTITGIGLDSKYLVPDNLLSNASIANTSLLIHSNYESKAIVFTGNSINAITHTEELSNAAYIRLNDNDSIEINSGTDEESSISLGKNNGSYINIGQTDLTVSHSSAINIKRNTKTIIQIASETDTIPLTASATTESLLLNAKKIGVLAKELQLNSVHNYIRIGESFPDENISVHADKGNINIHAFDTTAVKGKISMLGTGTVFLGAVDKNGADPLTYVSAIEILKNIEHDRKNKIRLISNEIILSTSKNKDIYGDNAGQDVYIRIKNGNYDYNNKSIELVTTHGAVTLRNGEVDNNNVILLDRTDSKNNILLAGAILNKPGIRLDNTNNNIQLTGKTIWNDGGSFIAADSLPDLKSVHIRKNATSNSPNLILSTNNADYCSSRLLYGYQGSGPAGHTSTEQSVTVNTGSIKLSYGSGDHYNNTVGYNQGFVIRNIQNTTSSNEFESSTSPGFKIIEGSSGANLNLNINSGGIYSKGDLHIVGNSNFDGNCNVGNMYEYTKAKLTATNTSMPGIIYSCTFVVSNEGTIRQTNIWGPLADITGNIDSDYKGNMDGPQGPMYGILLLKTSKLLERRIYNGIRFILRKRKNANGSWGSQIDLTKDFTVQITANNNNQGGVTYANYFTNISNSNDKSLYFHTYAFNSHSEGLALVEADNVTYNVTIIGPIVKVGANGDVLWDFRS